MTQPSIRTGVGAFRLRDYMAYYSIILSSPPCAAEISMAGHAATAVTGYYTACSTPVVTPDSTPDPTLDSREVRVKCVKVQKSKMGIVCSQGVIRPDLLSGCQIDAKSWSRRPRAVAESQRTDDPHHVGIRCLLPARSVV